MTERIFISYRRDDSAGHAGRVFDRLRLEFGQDVLFMDVDAIPLGMNFVRVLHEEVAKCGVLLAIVGPGWLDAEDENGARRLDQADDFVRVEIAAALQRDIPVIPILLEGARIPKAQELPNDLKELSQRNGLDVRHASFHADIDRLVKSLRAREASPARRPPDAERQGYHPVPSADAVIAAQGRWLKDFNVDPKATARPPVFEHVFVRVVLTRNDLKSTAGTILTGHSWDGTDKPWWKVLHGYCDGPTAFEFPDYLSYLGPTWRTEYAQLGAAIFKKLGAKPLASFIKHPEST